MCIVNSTNDRERQLDDAAQEVGIIYLSFLKHNKRKVKLNLLTVN